MKRYGFRLWSANALAVVALLVLLVFLLGHFVPGLAQPADALLPALTVLVCACSLLFAVVEAVFLYRSWRSASRERN